MARRVLKAPLSRLGWHEFYATAYNRHRREDCAVLAMWYLFLHLAFDAEEK